MKKQAITKQSGLHVVVAYSYIIDRLDLQLWFSYLLTVNKLTHINYFLRSFTHSLTITFYCT